MSSSGTWQRFYGTTVGKKIVMAFTGLILLGFVLVHMLGNLQLFSPGKGEVEALDAYGEFLRSMPLLLWTSRAVLLLAATLHVLSAAQLTLKSWASRPVAYAREQRQETTLAARSMRWGGVVIAIFVIYHVLHFTVGVLHPDQFSGGFHVATVRHNVVVGFSFWYVAAFYVAAMIVLALHLWHGAWSVWQTLGLEHPNYDRWRRVFAVALTLVIFAGFVAVPLAVASRWVPERTVAAPAAGEADAPQR